MSSGSATTATCIDVPDSRRLCIDDFSHRWKANVQISWEVSYLADFDEGLSLIWVHLVAILMKVYPYPYGYTFTWWSLFSRLEFDQVVTFLPINIMTHIFSNKYEYDNRTMGTVTATSDFSFNILKLQVRYVYLPCNHVVSCALLWERSVIAWECYIQYKTNSLF